MLWDWLKASHTNYERKLHDPEERDTSRMGRWAEGSDAINSILTGLEAVPLRIANLRKELEDEYGPQ